MAAYLKKPFRHNPLITRKLLIRVIENSRSWRTGSPAARYPAPEPATPHADRFVAVSVVVSMGQHDTILEAGGCCGERQRDFSGGDGTGVKTGGHFQKLLST
jgi:hypothetical protein